MIKENLNGLFFALGIVGAVIILVFLMSLLGCSVADNGCFNNCLTIKHTDCKTFDCKITGSDDSTRKSCFDFCYNISRGGT